MEYQVRHLELAHGVRFKDRTAHPLDELMTLIEFFEYFETDENEDWVHFNPYSSEAKDEVNGLVINKSARYRFLIQNNYPMDEEHLSNRDLKGE